MREFGTPRQEEKLYNHVDLVNMLGIVNLEAGTSVSIPAMCSHVAANNQNARPANSNGQTDPGHTHKAPDCNHQATQPMVNLMTHKLKLDATECTARGTKTDPYNPKLTPTPSYMGGGKAAGSINALVGAGGGSHHLGTGEPPSPQTLKGTHGTLRGFKKFG